MALVKKYLSTTCNFYWIAKWNEAPAHLGVKGWTVSPFLIRHVLRDCCIFSCLTTFKNYYLKFLFENYIYSCRFILCQHYFSIFAFILVWKNILFHVYIYVYEFFLGDYERLIFSEEFYKWRNNICISRKGKKNGLIIKWKR